MKPLGEYMIEVTVQFICAHFRNVIYLVKNQLLYIAVDLNMKLVI